MTSLQGIETRVRATRRVSSLPLIVIGVGTVVGGLSPLAGELEPVVALGVTPVAAIALWIVMKVTATRAGLGMGREKYGLLAFFFVIASSVTIVSYLLGPAFLLGLLLFAVGWRAEDQLQWISGLALTAASGILNYSFINNVITGAIQNSTGYYWLVQPSIDDLLLSVFGFVLAVLGGRRFAQESNAMRRRSE